MQHLGRVQVLEAPEDAIHNVLHVFWDEIKGGRDNPGQVAVLWGVGWLDSGVQSGEAATMASVTT